MISLLKSRTLNQAFEQTLLCEQLVIDLSLSPYINQQGCSIPKRVKSQI